MAIDASHQQFLRHLLKRAVVTMLIGLGVYMVSFGGSWGTLALDLLPDSIFGRWIELFVPFLPIAPLYGAALAASSPLRQN